MWGHSPLLVNVLKQLSIRQLLFHFFIKKPK
jgi:hypothetical protein